MQQNIVAPQHPYQLHCVCTKPERKLFLIKIICNVETFALDIRYAIEYSLSNENQVPQFRIHKNFNL